MILTMISILMLMNVTFFPPKYPMKFTLLLMMFSFSIIYNINTISMSNMYAYMLFLIMIGGVIIMLLYFTSLSMYMINYIKNNNILNYSYIQFSLYACILFFVFNFHLHINYKEHFKSLMMMEEFMKIYSNMEESFGSLSELYSFYMMPMILFCMTILIFMLFFISKFSVSSMKPLRMKNINKI